MDEEMELVYDSNGVPVTRSSRIFWSGGGWDCPWWKPIILDGIRGGDENCNRTIGLKLPGGALFLCLNIPLRQEPCEPCKRLWGDL